MYLQCINRDRSGGYQRISYRQPDQIQIEILKGEARFYPRVQRIQLLLFKN